MKWALVAVVLAVSVSLKRSVEATNSHVATATAPNFWSEDACSKQGTICTYPKYCPQEHVVQNCTKGVCCAVISEIPGLCQEHFHNNCQDECAPNLVMKNGQCPDNKKCCILLT